MSDRPVRTRNDAALRGLEPFLVTAPWQIGAFDLEPFGFGIAEEHAVDPTRACAAGFVDRLCTLDALTFGPEGMPMPRWLFTEAAGIPGGIFGFGARAEELTASLRDRLRLVGGDRGLVPLSMYIAIPVEPPRVWYGHNLASLNALLPELSLGGLATITKAVGLRCFRCETQVGATQWGSRALHVHTKLGPLELLTAWTPGHADPATLTYRVGVDEQRLRFMLGDPAAAAPPRPEATEHLDPRDADAMRRLQARLEAGDRFAIPGPPARDAGGRLRVPVSLLPGA